MFEQGDKKGSHLCFGSLGRGTLKPGQKQGTQKFQRVPAFGLVRVQSSKKSYSGALVNISCGGLMLKGQELPEPDEEITLSFSLAPFGRGFFLKAIVVWVAATTDLSMPRGMGVRFVNIDKESDKRIEEYIEKSISRE